MIQQKYQRVLFCFWLLNYWCLPKTFRFRELLKWFVQILVRTMKVDVQCCSMKWLHLKEWLHCWPLRANCKVFTQAHKLRLQVAHINLHNRFNFAKLSLNLKLQDLKFQRDCFLNNYANHTYWHLHNQELRYWSFLLSFSSVSNLLS